MERKMRFSLKTIEHLAKKNSLPLLEAALRMKQIKEELAYLRSFSVKEDHVRTA